MQDLKQDLNLRFDYTSLLSELECCEICDPVTFHLTKSILFDDTLRLTVCLSHAREKMISKDDPNTHTHTPYPNTG